ncbi:haloacid dehalogenase-like hydrolase [Saccharopolyspora sp. SCSIO 74807]|uniref:haloacid dehalogenase-like hydrolase n=1 Tax=Saccharopolyspora sp. SCSIO 74807 TaxID=3118084 RepID=UPI0030CAC34F
MLANDRTLLLLWDIDHTLIESRGMGRTIYERIFPKATGHHLRQLATVHGRTELDIIHDTLEHHDIEPTEQAINDVAAALADGYRAATDELAQQGRVLPGALEALEAFAADPGLHQSVLTGNTTAVARTKIEAFGLEPYLDLAIGAYGDDHRERAELVTIARARAEQHRGTTLPIGNVVIVGDTPSDIEAALTAGAQSIAVASGKYSTDDLRSAGASTVLVALNQAVVHQALKRMRTSASA